MPSIESTVVARPACCAGACRYARVRASVEIWLRLGPLRRDLPPVRAFEPHPLEHGGLEHRSRRVGIVFEQLCRPLPAVAQIEAAVEARVARVRAARLRGP